MVDGAKLDALSEVVRKHWPVEIDNADLQKPSLVRSVEAARAELLAAHELSELA